MAWAMRAQPKFSIYIYIYIYKEYLDDVNVFFFLNTRLGSFGQISN
jgi:hypothetical protein